MGFIEDLGRRNQREAEKAAMQEAASVLKVARKEQLEREQILRSRAENRPQWEKARGQFNESGLLEVFQKAIDLKGAESYVIDPEDFGKMIYWKWDVGAPYFCAELHIKTIVKEHDEHYYVGGYSNKITTKYIGVRTDKDGAISFYGKKHPFDREGGVFVKVPKSKWQGNVEVMEDALGRVYNHPLTSERREMIGNHAFESFANIVDRGMNEHKEPKV